MKQTTENLNFSHKIETLSASNFTQTIYRRYYGAIQRDVFWTHIGIHVHNTWKRNLLSHHGYWLWLGIASVWHINLTIHIRSVTRGTLCQKTIFIKILPRKFRNLKIYRITKHGIMWSNPTLPIHAHFLWTLLSSQIARFVHIFWLFHIHFFVFQIRKRDQSAFESRF